MNKYEELLAEYEHLVVKEEPMLNRGLYCDGCVWIKKGQTTAQKACILAEEIGHYETSAGDILDTRDLSNAKQEARARRWAYKKLIPLRAVLSAFSNGHSRPDEIAEYLQVDETFLLGCLKEYGLIG